MGTGPRLWAISDLHVAYPDNAAHVATLRPSHPDDWLIVAGDVAERTELILSTLQSLASRYAKVIWVPGNHELYTSRRLADVPPSTEKYQDLVNACQEIGVLTPQDPFPLWTGPGGPAWVAPLFVPYDYSWRADPSMSAAEALARAETNHLVAADEELIDPSPYSSIPGWTAQRIGYSLARLHALEGEHPSVLVNHWPLVREPTRWLRHPDFCLWCGTETTSDWPARFRAAAVIYGHLHMPVTFLRDGVRFEECSLGYPREWQNRPAHSERPRQILPAPGYVEDLGVAIYSHSRGHSIALPRT